MMILAQTQQSYGVAIFILISIGFVFLLLANYKRIKNINHSDDPRYCKDGHHPDSKVEVNDYKLINNDPDNYEIEGVCKRCGSPCIKRPNSGWVTK